MNWDKMSWFVYGLIGMLSLSIMLLSFKYLTLKGLTSPVILLFIFGFGFVFYLFHIIFNKTPIKIDSTILFVLLFAALFSYIGNLFYVRAIGAAPNPGYASAINALNIIVITLVSIVLFSSKLTLVKALGILFAFVAIVLLAL